MVRGSGVSIEVGAGLGRFMVGLGRVGLGRVRVGMGCWSAWRLRLVQEVL